MPDCLKHSTASGIVFFIAFVGLRNAKLVVANRLRFVAWKFRRPGSADRVLRLALTLILMARRVNGAILIGISDIYSRNAGGISKWPSHRLPAARVLDLSAT